MSIGMTGVGDRPASWRRVFGGSMLLPLCLAIAAVPASAADGDMPAPGRFDMHPSGAGILRLDRVTGEIALCAAEDGTPAWSCRTVVEAAVAPASSERDTGEVIPGRAEAREATSRRLAEEPAGAIVGGASPRTSAAATDARPDGARPPSERGERDRLRQENARLSARIDELERRLAAVAAVARAGDAAGRADAAANAETDEAIADIDRAVRVGIYALARFRDLAEVLSTEDAVQEER